MKLGLKTLLSNNSRVQGYSTVYRGVKWNRKFSEDNEKTECKLNSNCKFIIKNI